MKTALGEADKSCIENLTTPIWNGICLGLGHRIETMNERSFIVKSLRMAGLDICAAELKDFDSSFEVPFKLADNMPAEASSMLALLLMHANKSPHSLACSLGTAGLQPPAGTLPARSPTIRISSAKLPAQSAKQPEPVALPGRNQ